MRSGGLSDGVGVLSRVMIYTMVALLSLLQFGFTAALLKGGGAKPSEEQDELKPE